MQSGEAVRRPANIAIPVAEREYVALYTRLVETLLEDPDFRAALKAAQAG